MIVLITGGASGLGEAITKKIAGQPDTRVYFSYSQSAERARELESEYPDSKAIKCDFRKPEEVAALAGIIRELDIDVLINNAYNGSFIETYFHKTEPEDFLEAFNNNIVPTITLTGAAINVFRKKRSGKIITVSSAALTNVPPLGSSVYAATKAYLEQLSKAWASENARFNITSNIISPGFMLTSLTAGMDERTIEQIQSSHPLKKLLTTAEAADSVWFLINSGRQINGVNLLINGGIDMR